jgi:hypothetical protein
MAPIGSDSHVRLRVNTRVLPVRYSARVTPEVLKTVLDELLIHEHTGSAAGVRAIDNDLLLGIERVQSMFQSLEMDRTIEPVIRLARNIQSSKQLTSLKSPPPSVPRPFVW